MASRTDTNGKNKLHHFLDLNEYGLQDVTDEGAKAAAKREIKDYLANEILRQLDKGNSPVKGEGRFKILNQDYAKKEKGGVRTANLELEGDLKDNFKIENVAGSFLKIGHEGESEVPKADGHNQISGKAQNWARKSKHPKRRYIPDSDQKFIDPIQKEIRKIIDAYKTVENNTATVDDLDDLITFGTTTTATSSPEQNEAGNTFIETDNFFSDDVIDALLADAQRRR